MASATEGAAGFSLIELLVALAILAMIAAGLMNLAGESTRTAAHLETRALAAIVADNMLAEAMLEEASALKRPAKGRVELGARSWDWLRSTTPAGDSGLLKVDIEVLDTDGRPVAQIWGFR